MVATPALFRLVTVRVHTWPAITWPSSDRSISWKAGVAPWLRKVCWLNVPCADAGATRVTVGVAALARPSRMVIDATCVRARRSAAASAVALRLLKALPLSLTMVPLTNVSPNSDMSRSKVSSSRSVPPASKNRSTPLPPVNVSSPSPPSSASA